MLLLALLLLAQPADTTKADSVGRDIIFYGGKRVIFFAKTEEVVLLDSAWVRYRDMSVFSDSIHYDVKKHALTAHKDVLFNAGSENITGALLEYDVDSRKGMMRTARTAVENGFFRADEVWLVRERVMDARRASYTTCDHDRPHYVFYGPRVKLLMDDIAIAEPMVFKLFNVPVLAAPFWMVPVASKRKSGLLPFKIGNSQTEGFYSKNLAYYLVINDYSDMTFYADLMTKKGLQSRVEGVYIVNPFASGNFNGSYIRELDTKRPRYSITGQHQSKFLFGSELAAKADFTSDASYVPDYSEEQLEWLKPDIYSYAEITRALRHVGSFSAVAQEKTDYRIHYRYADLPSVKLSISSRPLPGGWNASPSASFGHHADDYLDSTNTLDTARVRNLAGNAALGIASPSYSIGTLGAASVSEGLGFSEARSYYNDSLTEQPRKVSNSIGANMDQRFLGTFSLTEGVGLSQSVNLRDTLPVAVAYTGSVTSRVTLYRVYSIEALGMHGLLHSLSPTATLSYQPKVDLGPLFGRPRLLDPQNAIVNLGLGNTFQAKVDTLRIKRDLGSVNFSSSYDLLKKHLTPLRGIAHANPLQGSNLNLAIDASAGFDFDSLDLSKDYSIATTFYLNRIANRTTDSALHAKYSNSDDQWPSGFQLGLTHTYGRSGGSTVNMITGTAALAIPGWKLSLTDFGYNFAAAAPLSKITNYGLMLTKDLHCWEAFAKYQRLGGHWTYDFEVRIKKLPDLKIGKGTFGSVLPKGG